MSDSKTLTHLDSRGHARMVDVTEKAITERVAVAEGFITMNAETLDLVASGGHSKGDVLAVARIAGIQAAKKCADLIPLCHPLALTSVNVAFDVLPEQGQIRVTSRCKLAGRTGVEMEALTSASVALLTIYDMCKAVDKHMVMGQIRVLEKQGGKSGDWKTDDQMRD